MNLLTVCLVICLITVAGYIWGKYSLGTVACMSMILFLITGCITPQEALGNLSNSNVVLVLSMFVVSAGFKRTQAVKIIGRSVSAMAKGSMIKVMLGFTIASILAATFMGGAAAAFCIMAPLVTATCEELKIHPSKVIFSVGLVCIAACGILPMGGGLSMYAEVNGYIAANDYAQYQLGVMDMFKGRFPSLLTLALYTTFVGFRFSPDQPVTDTKSGEEFAVKSNRPPLAPFQEKCGYVIFFLVTVALLFNAPINRMLTHVGLASLASWEIVLIGAFLMVLTGVLSSKEACAALPMDLGFLIAGSLCMGTALANTGGGEIIGGAIAGVADQLKNPYLVGAVFYLVPFLLTQVMQNRTVMAIFQPIAILACKSMGVSCVGPAILVAAACCTAFMTPMATASIPMIMEVGGYNVQTQLKQSIIPAIFLSAVNIFWVMTVFPL